METMTKETEWFEVCKTGDVPEREGRKVVFEDKEIALFHVEDDYKAIDNKCPHKQGPLADGLVFDDSVFCPLHVLNIDLANGCALKGGEGQVRTYPVKVREGKIYIAIHEGKYSECKDA